MFRFKQPSVTSAASSAFAPPSTAVSASNPKAENSCGESELPGILALADSNLHCVFFVLYRKNGAESATQDGAAIWAAITNIENVS